MSPAAAAKTVAPDAARRTAKARAVASTAKVVQQAGVPGHVLNASDVPSTRFRTDLVDPVLSFVVYGVPAPQGSKEYAGHRNGKPVLKEVSAYLDPWRSAVTAMSVQAMREHTKRTGKPWTALDEPVMVSLVVTVPGSAAQAARGDLYAVGTPDLDKLQRAVGDSLSPTPLSPDVGKGMPASIREQVREKAMAERRRRCVLRDDSRIAVWDHCVKVYPASTVESLGFSGATIRVWRLSDLAAAARQPARVAADGRMTMRAGDLAEWARPWSGESWEEAAGRLWGNPSAVLACLDQPVSLRGRSLTDPAMCAALAALAVRGPAAEVDVVPEAPTAP